MAKILVADDNSNVQKTVTLALANLGIEVVSVNNGDAAVRKLADFSPDLVLADIFMPVRNGYEVCEYVKKDSRFSKVPVVLLVGAFDPLDEREAQRVGADGILKKPFVPPDPLITMVKTLLDRTLNDRLVEVAASKSAAVTRARSGGSVIAEEYPPVAVAAEEPASPEFPLPVGRVAFGDGEHPVAFSQLLETPAEDAVAPATDFVEPVDDEQILTNSRDATLGDPMFWRNDEPESEPAPEPEHLGDVSPVLKMGTWNPEGDSLPRRDETALLQPIEPVVSSGHTDLYEPLELIRDEQDDNSPTVVEPGSILLDQAGQAALTVDPDRAEELAANPIEWMATVPSERSLESSPEQLLEHSEQASETTPGLDEVILDTTDTIDTADAAQSPELRQALPPKSASVPEQLPASVVTPVSEQSLAPEASPLSAQPETKLVDQAPHPTQIQPVVSPLAQSAEDTVRSVPKQNWADLTASIHSYAKELVPQNVSAASTPAAPITSAATGDSQLEPLNTEADSSPDPALVEAVVQRVLDKMRPQVVDIITKEFLRPIVQALVHREIEKH